MIPVWATILAVLVSSIAGGVIVGALTLRWLRPAEPLRKQTLEERGEATLLKIEADRFRNLLAFFLITAFVAMLPVLLFKEMPKENSQVITYIIGQLSGMATGALAAYFTQKQGQDALDAKRTENTGRALDAMKAIAEGTAAPGSAEAGKAAGRAAEKVAEAATDKADEIKDKVDPKTGNYEEGNSDA